MALFRDRRHAGQLLAAQFEVARALEAPLDVYTVRKLGVPGHEELAFGAIATGGDGRGGSCASRCPSRSTPSDGTIATSSRRRTRRCPAS